MFLRFHSQDERKEYGDTCFIEIQSCSLPTKSSIKQIMGKIEFWRDDSLYVYGDSPFYQTYKNVFGYGIHHDMSEGYFDYYGITYYRADQIDEIKARALDLKPDGYVLLLDWLEEISFQNGFYILGM